jgi:hypothetical protein
MYAFTAFSLLVFCRPLSNPDGRHTDLRLKASSVFDVNIGQGPVNMDATSLALIRRAENANFGQLLDILFVKKGRTPRYKWDISGLPRAAVRDGKIRRLGLDIVDRRQTESYKCRAFVHPIVISVWYVGEALTASHTAHPT